MSRGKETAQLNSLDEFLSVLRRRKILWELTIGVVADVRNGTWLPDTLIPVTINGDSNTVPAYSMIGAVAGGAQVLVIQVSSTGFFIAGAVGAADDIRPWGLVCGAFDTADSALVSTAETIVLTTDPGLFASGRAFQLTFAQRVQSDTSGNYARFKVRQTDISGATLFDSGDIGPMALGPGSDYPGNGVGYFVNTLGSDFYGSLVLTLVRVSSSGSAGNVQQVGAGGGRSLVVEDIGPASRLPDDFNSLT